MIFSDSLAGPMLEGASPARLSALLEEYEAFLENALGGNVRSTMAAGLDRVEIEAKLASRGLRCPDEVAVWFAWHNGVPRVDGRASGGIPLFYPSSLDECLAVYDRTRQDLEVAFANSWDYELASNGSGEGWLRLDPLGESIAVNCREGGSSPVEVRWTDRDFTDPQFAGRFRALSLCTVVARWIHFAKDGAFRWSPVEFRWVEVPGILRMDLTGSILG